MASPALAGDGLDVKDWLSRPGVKLLAVEFYASWCGPCKKAVPRWKALHEKYRNQGLRLVVVSVQDPDGACVNPGWNPDDVVCDTEGRLAEAWGVGDKLPAAFLWTWRGPLLVRKGHVAEVERAAEEELRRMPRVTLNEGMPEDLRELLRTELARTGKVDVVAGAEEDEVLAAIRRKSHELQFSDRTACRIGARLAANSLLKASFVAAGGGKRLLVQLFSAETGCLNGSAGVFWNVEKPDLSVAEAIAELVNNLRVAVALPARATPATVKERESGEREVEHADSVLDSADRARTSADPCSHAQSSESASCGRGLHRIRFSVAPSVATDALTLGAFSMAMYDYTLPFPMRVEAGLRSIGFLFAEDFGAPFQLDLIPSYDGDFFELGLGTGYSYSAHDEKRGVSFLQKVRLGRVDGIHFTLRNSFVFGKNYEGPSGWATSSGASLPGIGEACSPDGYADGQSGYEVDWSSFDASLLLPLSRVVTLSLEGAYSRAGWEYATLGVRPLVIGDGGDGTLIIPVAIGVGSISVYASNSYDEAFCDPVKQTWQITTHTEWDRTTYAGPLLSVGLEYQWR